MFSGDFSTFMQFFISRQDYKVTGWGDYFQFTSIWMANPGLEDYLVLSVIYGHN